LVERVNDFFENQRHGNIGELSHDEQRQREHDPALEFPKVWQQGADRFPVIAISGWLFQTGGAHSLKKTVTQK
jgi:hypothetical protein